MKNKSGVHYEWILSRETLFPDKTRVPFSINCFVEVFSFRRSWQQVLESRTFTVCRKQSGGAFISETIKTESRCSAADFRIKLRYGFFFQVKRKFAGRCENCRF
jgi:hypothetical protein